MNRYVIYQDHIYQLTFDKSEIDCSLCNIVIDRSLDNSLFRDGYKEAIFNEEFYFDCDECKRKVMFDYYKNGKEFKVKFKYRKQDESK